MDILALMPALTQDKKLRWRIRAIILGSANTDASRSADTAVPSCRMKYASALPASRWQKLMIPFEFFERRVAAENTNTISWFARKSLSRVSH